ncbi:mandelate racemase/muconate lactonizing enzyme family protein [Budviciaceae bacterium BWR-B9]|uniref:Mandelate racemase/muconate lactonizing enzyme family protein n=2 Tax=Limnobaculum TaxID=2172100 RepID=A0A411WQQ2_9GAMM|nr:MULTISPECIES: mandelate racemase/muconate lactonizing enzyme family protein [Limnobaculum]MBK5143884.1 mandelate racemase/muconate lactonizing enzyme family protein [Limnobaculum allomyrinae]MBV7691542.1 mandelate racemase/muconate lactonizing enzyme family protein [Limnobaculum sp. M2-1]QBH98460.1 mandelate racemase/muconate lactonizing enzyme family protein [Limnobaculum zhutongyuii]TQS89642.1 mandelate racemase/muconate lactonizing enzyme family protein [Limnobaculum zhutongyuii]
MKIVSVDIIDVKNPLQSAVAKWRPIVVRINTDEGISGFGEVGMAYGVGASAGFGMAKDLASIIIGMDPMETEKIWDKMQKKTFWGQGGGTVVSAGMSAIDVALWDIKGKALNVPCYQLLGGKCRDTLRTYASQLQFGWGDAEKKEILTTPEQYAAAAEQAVADGYDAIKVDVNEINEQGGVKKSNLYGVFSDRELKVGYKRLKAIRDAIGDDIDIIVEAHALTDTASAIRFGRMIEELRISAYEEPVMNLNPGQLKEVKQNVNIPIAAGERIYTRWGFRPFFEEHIIDLIQPDLGTCGGFSEAKKICDMGHIYDTTCQIHVCGGPIMTAASLQLECAIPNFGIHELHRYSLLDGNRATCKYDYLPENGQYSVPDLPGIGQELTDKSIAESPKETVK